MSSQPTPAIEALAKYALEHEQFRRDASRVDNFQNALQQYPNVDQLTAEEINFCEGWLYLAQLQFTAPDDLDHHIVVSVQASLYAAQGSTRSG